MSSSQFCYVIHIHQVALCIYSSNSCFVNQYLTIPASLSSLSELSTLLITIGFHKFQLFSSFNPSYSGNIDIPRSNMFCDGCTKNYGGRSINSTTLPIFSMYPQVRYAPRIQHKTTTLFSRKLRCPDVLSAFFSVIAICFKILVSWSYR